MKQLLNKKVKINHFNNINLEATDTTNTLEVTVWDVRSFDDSFVMINGGWLLPIEEVNSIILES